MNNGAVMKLNMDGAILRALREDITSEDITTNAVVLPDKHGKADLICKQSGIIAGLEVFRRVFELLDPTAVFESTYKDGDAITKGDRIGVLSGDLRAILSGERTALNFLQRMSGIATFTKDLSDELVGTNTKLLDTRKTTPNMRVFEKYAVKAGGGYNHRFNLSDGVLIKDNHIGAAGGVKQAIQRAKEYAPFVRKIEVEVESLAMLDEALEAGADIIMLDNMCDEDIRTAVIRVAGRAQTECSGNITKDRLRQLAAMGVDFISVGALTHSAPILDLSLKNLQATK